MAFLLSWRRLADSPHRGLLDLAVRLAGLLLLPLVLGLTRLLWHLRHTPLPHRVMPTESALAGAVILLFWISSLLVVAGSALLRPVPKPPRPLFS